jgi:ferredoxin/flavodoxin
MEILKEPFMTTELYYYSGTGNSLHVARELQKRLPESKIIPIVGLLKRDAVKTNAETVGIVFPIYLSSMPIPVCRFLDKADLGSAKYVFAAATRIGTFHIADFNIGKLLRRTGRSLDAFFNLNMVSNSPCGLVPRFPGFDKITNAWTGKISPENVARLDAAVGERLSFVIDTVAGRKRHFDERSFVQQCVKLLARTFIPARPSVKNVVPYYTDATCIGCGTCEKVCPSGRVGIVNGKPVWRKGVPCYVCFACFNSCPQQAILIEKRYTMKKGRYLHPGVSADDIARQKE